MDPTGAESAGRARFGNRRVGAACTTCPTPVRVHIHLDANRDGEVDDRWWLNGSWSAGQGRLGAVVLCNCDDENGDKEEDHTNDRIDGVDDEPDIAPFHLRKHPAGAKMPAGWKVVIEVLQKRHSLFRIFHRDQAGGTEILGPERGPSHQLADLSRDEWRFGMETNQYPGRIKDPDVDPGGVKAKGHNWNGFVRVKLSLVDDAGVVRDSEIAKIRCAPWVVFNHMDPTEELYVVNIPADTDDAPTGGFIAELDAATGMPATQFQDGRDRWMQDVMEIGFSTLPRRTPAPDIHLPVPLRTKNRRQRWGELDPQVKERLLGKNYGYYEALRPIVGVSSLDSFGNLECVPPFVHPRTRRDYRFGRIIYGNSGGMRDIATEVTEFLQAQKVQFPFTVDTGWLVVGHIDEVLSFVPTPDGKLGFKAVFAGPARALELIRGRAAGPGVPAIFPLPPDTPMFRGITDFTRLLSDGTTTAQGYPKQTVGDVLDTSYEPNIVRASEYAQTKIDQIKQALRDEVGMTDDDFIDLPVLFRQFEANREDGRGTEPRCLAYTGGSANMLVVTRGPQTRAGARDVRLIVPKPFGPTLAPPGATGSAAPPCVFETDIAEKLRLTGVSHVFLDNFTTYHALYGEIHCGTNSKRKGAVDRFWWEQEGI